MMLCTRNGRVRVDIILAHTRRYLMSENVIYITLALFFVYSVHHTKDDLFDNMITEVVAYKLQ